MGKTDRDRIKFNRREFIKKVSASGIGLAGISVLDKIDAVWAQELPKERKVREIEFMITTPGYDPIRYDWCVMIANNWKKLGLDVALRPVETGVMISKGFNFEYDTMILSWGGRPERIDPDFWLFTIFHSSNNRSRGYNLSGYMNPEFDKLAEKQRTTMDPKERKKAVFDAQELLARDQPESPVLHQDYIHAYNKADFSSVQPMMGEGLNSLWTFIRITPKSARKILKYGHPEDLKTLNPLQPLGLHEMSMFRIIYDTITVIDQAGKATPWMAKEIKIVNETTIDVVLKSDMTFHDGKPVTAEDVKFTFDYLREWKAGGFASYLEPVDKVETPGKLNVRFFLKRPSAPFISNSLSSVYILPKHIWKDVPQGAGIKTPQDWDNWKSTAIGSGPFKFVSWKRGEEFRLARHDAHFSKPRIEGIIRITFGDMQGLVFALQNKDVDVVGWNLSPLQAKTLQAVPHIEVVNVPNHGQYPIRYNIRRKPFDSVAFRRALAYCIPKKKIVKDFYEGYAVEAQSMIGPMIKEWHNPKIEKFDENLDKARETLKKAGYEWDSAGKLYYPR